VLEVPAAGPGQAQTARLADVRSLAGSRASFSIEVSGGGDRFSAPSGPVAVDIVRVPGPPEGLRALVDEGRIAVSWETPLEDADLVTGFRVYRDGAVLGEVAPELRVFEDRVYTEGAEYAYRVVAFRGGPSGVVEGLLPSPISVSATDRTAPAPPGPLSVRQVDGAPLVTWPPSPEADLAGYRIWVGEGAAGPFLPLGGALLANTLYSDAAGGGARTYAVSAVDRSGNESPLSEPAP
jgi:hypothetical protein